MAAVHGVDFTVPKGQFFTLLGPSGSGKSTTMRCVAGLERPTAGEIAIGETVVYSSAQNILVPTHRRAIGVVFQSYAVWPHMTVFGNVAYPLRARGVRGRDVKARVEHALRLVGMEELGSRPVPMLSGGQQQRVALARAVVAEPALLLLDEPLSNLDVQLRIQMRIELKTLQSRRGVTTLYVTHDQQEALAMSDEVAIIHQGRIVQQGPPDAIYHRPRSRFAATFIGSTNLIGGHCEAGRLRPGANRLETPLGPLMGWWHDPAPLDAATAEISVRPEVISLSDPPPGASSVNRLRGRVEHLVFLGESLDCRVRVGDTVLQVKGGTTAPPTVGAEVDLYLPPQFCVLIAGGPDQGFAPPAPNPAAE